MKIFTAAEAFEESRRNDPLDDYFTLWDNISAADVSALESGLSQASREEDLQQLLQQNPKFLIQHLGGGHGRWVIPKQRLGAEHVTDFVVGERSSIGFEWQAIELESPLRPMFNKSGDPSQFLNHAVRQIQDWRSWLLANQSYASRAKAEGGLGLSGINGNIRGLILIGRRSELQPSTGERRRQMMHDLNIRIHTYDYLLDSLKGRLRGESLWGRSPDDGET